MFDEQTYLQARIDWERRCPLFHEALFPKSVEVVLEEQAQMEKWWNEKPQRPTAPM